MLALRIARVFDGRAVVEGAGVVFVDGGRIAGVEAAGFGIPTGVEVIDRPSGTLLPDLVDAHVHLVGDGEPGALERLGALSQDDLFSTIERSLRIQLAAGVTTVRDLGDVAWSVVDWRARRPRTGLPTVVASGPPVTSRGGHCRHGGGQASGSDELRAAVRERAERGADIVKIMAGGGMTTPGSSVDQGRFTAEELALVVRQAHAVGLPVTAHAHALVSIRDAIAHAASTGSSTAGSSPPTACTCPRRPSPPWPPRASWCARRSAARRTRCLRRSSWSVCAKRAWTMTRCSRRVVRAHLAGVTIISGTDGGISPGAPHGSLPRAVMDLVSGGMAAADALASATSVAARACGLGDRKGRVRTGYDADLVVVDGDPFTDMAALNRADVTVLGGQVLGSRS